MAAFDALIGTVLRRINRRVFRFPKADGTPAIPPADSTKNYLLYLHVPYCNVLCPFCSFHRVRFKQDSAEQYFDCLRREIALVADLGYRFDEIYVGGGTPTVLPEQLARTLQYLRQQHPVNCVSVETNPDDLEKDSVARLRDVGVNRLSVGVQSFDDSLLAEMQRLDKYGSGEQIAAHLKHAYGRFDTLNIDMIFNFPHQTEQSLLRDLDILIDDIGAEQVSWYPLMTSNSARRPMLQHMGRVDYSRERQLYELIVERMLRAGYLRNSAWCFSREKGLFDEYIVDHEEYVGLGSGSFSYLQGDLYASTFSINHYRNLVAAGKTGIVRQRAMSEREQMHYYLLMRLFSGSLDTVQAEQRFAGSFGKVLWPELTALRLAGALQRDQSRLRLTEKGFFLWVTMMREFFGGVSDLRDDMRHHIAAEHFSVADQ